MLANIVVKSSHLWRKHKKFIRNWLKENIPSFSFLFFSFCVIMNYLNFNLSENYNFLKPNQHTVYIYVLKLHSESISIENI